MQKRRASIPSKGWKVSFNSAFKKREKKENKTWQRRKWEEGLKNENFRVPEREELPQKEKNYEKTRGPELQ